MTVKLPETGYHLKEESVSTHAGESVLGQCRQLRLVQVKCLACCKRGGIELKAAAEDAPWLLLPAGWGGSEVRRPSVAQHLAFAVESWEECRGELLASASLPVQTMLHLEGAAHY